MKKTKKNKKAPTLNFIWNYKSDLAEINAKNYRLVFQDYFRLSTKKITILAMILALNIVMTIFSKFVLGLIPVMGFFVIEISFFTVLIFLMISNLFYSLIFLELTVWFRVLLGSEPVGLIAMNITDGIFLIFFAFLIFLFKVIAVRLQITNFFKKLFYFEIIAGLLVILLTSGMAVLMNYWFILKLYGVHQDQIKGYLPLIFAFNILKYFINVLIYFGVYQPLMVLIKRYQF